MIFELIGLFIVVICASIQLKLDYSMGEELVARRNRNVRTLVVLIWVGAAITGIGIWQTHVEDRENERAAEEREHQATKERQAISTDIQNLVRMAREDDPSLTEREALRAVQTELRNLREKASQLEHGQLGLRRYIHFANFNVLGLTGIAGEGLKENSGIASALEGAYDLIEDDNGSKYYPRCDAEGINMFANVVRDFPDFPFSHWALAICLGKQSNPQWRTHLERAKEILEHTTQIAGHHQHHDEVLQQIERFLAVP